MKQFDYAEIAHDYDKTRYEGRKNVYIDLVRRNALISLLPKNINIKVLDVGCGTGRGVLFLEKLGYKVIGLDYTMNMLNVCKEKIENECIGLIRADANVIPFPDNTFDCIISLNFLHLFSKDEQKNLINEIARVLKSGGFFICEFDNYYRGIVAGKQTLKVNPTLHLNCYSDFKYLFSSSLLRVLKIQGDTLPYVWRIFQYIPNIGKHIETISYIFPFSLIASRFFVKSVKC